MNATSDTGAKAYEHSSYPIPGAAKPTSPASPALEPPSLECLRRAKVAREEGAEAQAELLQKALDTMKEDLGACQVESWSYNANFVEHRIRVQDRSHVLDVLALGESPNVHRLFGAVRTWHSDGDADTVVLEVPRVSPQACGIEEVVAQLGVRPALDCLDFAVGTDGTTVRHANLASLPRLFIASAGECSTVNKNKFLDAILCSLLMHAGPNELQLAIASSGYDGKWFAEYDGLPHLIAPVATNYEQATKLLRRCVEVEMRNRYQLLHDAAPAQEPANDGPDNHPTNVDCGAAPFPKLVVIVSELANLMPTSYRNALRVIAEDGPAVGIHLIAATTNLRAWHYVTNSDPDTSLSRCLERRICLAVEEQEESSLIIGHPGAEKLLRTGELMTDDGWHLAGESHTLQALNVPADFRNSLLSYWKCQHTAFDTARGDDGSPAVSDADDTGARRMKAEFEALWSALRGFGYEPRDDDCTEGPVSATFRLRFNSKDDIVKIREHKDDLARTLGAANVYVSKVDPDTCSMTLEIVTGGPCVPSFEDIAMREAAKLSEAPMRFVLGLDAAGEVVTADLATLPHVLIAGGSAEDRANLVDGILLSMLSNETSESPRFVMVDSDAAALSAYDGISRLAMPVMKAPGALRWVEEEMHRRYAVFARLKVRDLAAYARLAMQEQNLEGMAPLVVVIGDLSALFVTYGDEVPNVVTHLTQLGRAVGIYLVVATSLAGITAKSMQVVLNNMGNRIALHVATERESRAICGEPGAERLLAHGDLLFYSGASIKPQHVQGFDVLDAERETAIGPLRLNLPDGTK